MAAKPVPSIVVASVVEASWRRRSSHGYTGSAVRNNKGTTREQPRNNKGRTKEHLQALWLALGLCMACSMPLLLSQSSGSKSNPQTFLSSPVVLAPEHAPRQGVPSLRARQWKLGCLRVRRDCILWPWHDERYGQPAGAPEQAALHVAVVCAGGRLAGDCAGRALDEQGNRARPAHP